MKKHLIYYLSAFLLLFAAGCSDLADVEPTVDSDALTEANAQDQNLQGENLKKDLTKDEKFLKNLNVTGDLENGGTFNGKVTITSFDYDDELGLVTSGVIKGTATSSDGTETDVKKAFSNIATTLAEEGDEGEEISAAADCQILFLDIGPIFLDVLGLQVDLSQIVLDITAVSGSGNLLGNLLCAVAGLLDPGSGLLNFLEDLVELIDLLDQINDILSGL